MICVVCCCMLYVVCYVFLYTYYWQILYSTAPMCFGFVKWSVYVCIQWKPLIMITLGPALFDNNNWLITLSRGYKNLHYLTQFIVTTFYMHFFLFINPHTQWKLKGLHKQMLLIHYFYSVCSALRPPCPFAVEFSLASLLWSSEQLVSRKTCFDARATWGTIIYQYSTIGEFLPLMEMRCVRPLSFLVTGQS
jgi:hypothetical protein